MREKAVELYQKGKVPGKNAGEAGRNLLWEKSPFRQWFEAVLPSKKLPTAETAAKWFREADATASRG